MKKLFILFFFVFFACSSKEPINISELNISGNGLFALNNKPYSGPVFFVNSENKVFLEGNLKNGEKTDLWTYWYDHQNKITGYVKWNDNIIGNLLEFDENNKLISVSEYENGLKNGKSVSLKDTIVELRDSISLDWYEDYAFIRKETNFLNDIPSNSIQYLVDKQFATIKVGGFYGNKFQPLYVYDLDKNQQYEFDNLTFYNLDIDFSKLFIFEEFKYNNSKLIESYHYDLEDSTLWQKNYYKKNKLISNTYFSFTIDSTIYNLKNNIKNGRSIKYSFDKDSGNYYLNNKGWYNNGEYVSDSIVWLNKDGSSRF